MSIGFWQLILIVLIVLLVFGAGKLPRVMGDLGKGVRSMRDGLKEGEEEAPLADTAKEIESTKK